jgi:hypothetical protein
VKRHVLHDLLLLVHVALGHGHVLLGLEVELGRVRVAAPDALDGASVGLDVDDVPDAHALLLDRLEDARVQAQLLGALGRLESDEEVGDGAPVGA